MFRSFINTSIAIFLLTSNVLGQNLTFYGLLPVFNQTGRISDKFNYNLFLSSTFDAFKQTTYGISYPATDLQLYIQPSVIYVYSLNLNFSGSYTYQRNNPINENYLNLFMCAKFSRMSIFH